MPAGDMDSKYSIGVKNRFNGIDSDIIEDPLELIRAAQEKPKKDKDAKAKGGKKDVKAPAKGPTKEKVVKTEPIPHNPTEGNRESTDRPRGRGRGRGRGGDRGGRGRGGGGRGGFGGPTFNDDPSGENQPPRGPRGACHRCGEEGHFVRNCPQPKSPGGPPQNDGGFGVSNSGGFGVSNGGGFGTQSEGFGGAPSSGFGGGFGSDDDSRRAGGRGGFRGGRGGRGRGRGGRGGSREFDRRSGSDRSSVKAFDKRDGSGSYNWGTAQDELDASEEQQQQQQPQGFGSAFGAPTDVETPAETEETPEEGEAVSTEEETANKENIAEQMTLQEYKRQQEETRSKPQYNIRKANEGEKMKGMKQLKKPTEEENEADGSLFFPKKYYEEKLKTSGRVKEHMNLEFQFTTGDNRHMDSNRRGGRSRGGRGGRGGRGRDEHGGGFGSSKQIQLENADEFPVLG